MSRSLPAATTTRPRQPITGAALDQATAAALAHTGGGRVTETEVGDEESLYEVEVTLADGSQVDVQLDESFEVVGSEDDGGRLAEDRATSGRRLPAAVHRRDGSHAQRIRCAP